MAESYGNFRFGNDISILPYVEAVNIACGFHGGDPLTIVNTIESALELGKEIGAHPSFPDLVGFGRRNMDLSCEELSAVLTYQICAIKSITESLGGKLNHVKVHGALYNRAWSDINVAEIILKSIHKIDPSLIVFAPFNSCMADLSIKHGLTLKNESFADRLYTDAGRLSSRDISGSTLETPEKILAQVEQILNGKIITNSGRSLDIKSDTICFHSDNANVVDALILVKSKFK